MAYDRNSDKMVTYCADLMTKHADLAAVKEDVVKLSKETASKNDHYQHSEFVTTVVSHVVMSKANKLLIVPASMGKSFIILLAAELLAKAHKTVKVVVTNKLLSH